MSSSIHSGAHCASYFLGELVHIGLGSCHWILKSWEGSTENQVYSSLLQGIKKQSVLKNLSLCNKLNTVCLFSSCNSLSVVYLWRAVSLGAIEMNFSGILSAHMQVHPNLLSSREQSLYKERWIAPSKYGFLLNLRWLMEVFIAAKDREHV